MASGVVVAFAPFFLEVEIQKYIPTIAEEKGVSIDRIQQEWRQFKAPIRCYEPAPSKQPESSVDLKDMDYVRVLEQVNGDFIYTSDSDFLKMGTRVMPPGLDRVLQDYARNNGNLDRQGRVRIRHGGGWPRHLCACQSGCRFLS